MRIRALAGCRQPMTRHANHRTSVSSLLGASVIDPYGNTYGRVTELAVSPLDDAAHICGMLVRRPSHQRETPPSLVRISELESSPDSNLRLRPGATPASLPKDE